jgi:DNA-directed RNA polymerase subunit RPC12/RpoP
MNCPYCGSSMLPGTFAIQSSPTRFAFVGASWDALSFLPEGEPGSAARVVIDSGIVLKGYHCPDCASNLIHGSGITSLTKVLNWRPDQD